MAIDNDADLLDALYRGATLDSELLRALTILSNRFRCQSTSLISINSRKPAANMAISTGVFDEAARRLYSEQFAPFDPAPAAFARMRIGTASTTDRVLSKEQLRRGVFVNDFYRPLGLVETIGGNLYSDDGCFELIGLQRGSDRPAFEDAELAAVERLMPHIARALQIRRAFLRLEDRVSGLEAAVDRLQSGVAVLDGDGVALFVNRAMSAIAERGDGIGLDRRGRPVLAGRDAPQRFNALLRDVLGGGPGGALTVPRASGVRPYAMLVAPVPRSAEPRGAPSVLVIVHDPAARTPSNPDILQQSLGLPRGAARLVAALASDDNLQTFAEREGVTIHTARFHLRTALARTGTRTQSELVRLAVGLLRDFGLRDGNRD